MNRKEVIKYIKMQEPSFLQAAPKKANGQLTYICPVCGNGTGESGDGIARKQAGENYTCFKCKALGEEKYSMSVIDLYMEQNQCDFNMAVTKLCDYYHIVMNWDGTYKADNEQILENMPTSQEQKPKQDYSQYHYNCMMRLYENKQAMDYLKARGLSEKTLSHFMVGYDPQDETIILPTSDYSHTARKIASNTPKNERYKHYGAIELLNKEVLYADHKQIYVVEGEIDTLSLEEVGAKAVGLGSASNYKKLVDEIKKANCKSAFILALDNDETGQKAQKTLYDEMKKLQINVYQSNVAGSFKDANERLQKDRQGLQEDANKDIACSNYEKETNVAQYIDKFRDILNYNSTRKAVSTGIEKIDKLLDGGFYAGLYCIGAISSLGKTTLTLQIADYIASCEKDVIIFSLEMAKSEIMAKSISRLTYDLAEYNNIDETNARTTRAVLQQKYSEIKKYQEQQQQLFLMALNKYEQEIAKHLYIYEGIGNISVKEILNAVSKHKAITGNTPIVIIDYLQILAPYDPKYSDKQNTDKAVLELKRISRDYNTPVIAISSFNRNSYKDDASMTSFKESGAIEYSSDVLIGLDLYGVEVIDKKTGKTNIEELKSKDTREINFRVLKNRNGRTGTSVVIGYKPKFNKFMEIEQPKKELKEDDIIL